MVDVDAIRNALYGKLHPLVHAALRSLTPHLGGYMRTGHRANWEHEFTERLDRSLTAVADRIMGPHKDGAERMEKGINPAVVPELLSARDLMCTISSQERYYFPKWFGWWVEELERQGLIVYDPRARHIRAHLFK